MEATKKERAKKGAASIALAASFFFCATIAHADSFYTHGTVIETYPFSGLTSDSHSSVGNAGAGFMQPLGNLAGASGWEIDAINIYTSETKTNNNGGDVITLYRYATADYSGSALDSCGFVNNALGTSNTPYTGYLTFGVSGTCFIQGDGYYLMSLSSSQANINAWTVQGANSTFSSGQGKLRFSNTASSYSSGSDDSTVATMWFQMVSLNAASSTPAEFLLGPQSTSTDSTSLNELLNNIGSQSDCQASTGVVGYNLCKVFAFLFSPNPRTFTDYADFFQTIERKPPFGYYGAMKDAFGTFSTTTTATSSSAYIMLAAAAAPEIYGTFFDQWNLDLSIILYLMLGVYIMVRITKFDFHA